MFRIDTVDHLFSRCSELIDIWSRIAIWWGVQTPAQITVQSLLSCSDSIALRDGQRKVFQAVIFTSFWYLWNFCNNLVVGKILPRKSNIFDDIVHKTFFSISNRCRKAKFGWSSWLHNPTSTTLLM